MQAFKLGHFVDDYRKCYPAFKALLSDPNGLAASKAAKAVCSLLFTCFMNINWFIKSGLLKWDKSYWGDKQSLVRIWVAIYGFFPAVVAYRKAVATADKRSSAERRAVRETQIDIVKVVLDFFTYVQCHISVLVVLDEMDDGCSSSVFIVES